MWRLLRLRKQWGVRRVRRVRKHLAWLVSGGRIGVTAAASARGASW